MIYFLDFSCRPWPHANLMDSKDRGVWHSLLKVLATAFKYSITNWMNSFYLVKWKWPHQHGLVRILGPFFISTSDWIEEEPLEFLVEIMKVIPSGKQLKVVAKFPSHILFIKIFHWNIYWLLSIYQKLLGLEIKRSRLWIKRRW